MKKSQIYLTNDGNNLIFRGNLDSKEYFHLWFKKRKPFFAMYFSLLTMNFLSSIFFAISFLYKDSIWGLIRVISLALCLTFSISLGVVWYFAFTTGGNFPRGETSIYQDDAIINIVWEYKNKYYSKTIEIKNKMVINDHLLIEESRKNFAFLPLEVESRIKSDFLNQ